MLLPYTTHIYFGKAAGAVVDDIVTEEALASKQISRGGMSDQVAVLDQAKATELIGQAFGDQVVVETVSSARQVATAGVVDSIGASPSEYDIAQAVWLIQSSAINYPGTAGAKLNSAGGGGVDPQAIRDAMTLATAETPATGSVDDKLNKIKVDTGLTPAAL